ncbi:MAG TPA: prolyl oligopeptidase family serine peptidase [Pyrinomonadaceae bacterium]|nr:prolyl oligopeptidase family serine peptidase [Pyrinomonadaceae bacterium]
MKMRPPRRGLGALCAVALLSQQIVFAQQSQPRPAKRFELTVDSIMRGPGLVGYQPEAVRWSQDGRRVFFRWKQAGDPRLREMDTYVVNRDGTGLRKLTEEEAREAAPPTSGDLSEDKTMTVFADEGDVFIYDHREGRRRQITRTTEAEQNPRFTQDQKRIYFTRQNNLYLLSLDGGSLEQLTDIRVGVGGGGPQAGRQGGAAEQRGTESQENLKKEERALLEAVRERAENRERLEARRKERERRKPLNLPAGQNVFNLTLSPDGRFVVATVNEPATGAKPTIVPNYVTESAYTEDLPARTKVGDAQGRSRQVIISVETGDVRNVDHGQREVAPQVRTRTEQNASEQTQRERGDAQPPQVATPRTQTDQTAQQQGQQSQQQSGQQGAQQQPPRTQTERTTEPQQRDREVQLFQLQWSDDARRAALLARSADNKDRWVLLLDPETGKTRVVAHVRDEAWVNGPGAFTLGWLPDNRSVYFISERDGYAHLYSVPADGGEPRQLTSGQFEVSDVRLSNDKTKFYFTSSEGGPFERHLYSMPVGGGARTRLTTMAGNNITEISPDESALAIVHSYSNKPWELYITALAPGSQARQITTSPTPEFSTYNWIDPPIVSFRARDGATVHARIYKPANWRRGGPAVLFVHGAGYLQNVHKWWSNYYREYMFHHLLMERGYIVLDIDYRGSAGYGRDWRTGIYRHMGGKDLTDHVDGVQYLIREHGVDPRRVGIYGGSYGGFITFMAMFTTPDVFAAGAALRPVTDWAHYNHPYTSNILNLPQSDEEAYKRSSPIYHAEGLKGALLICHGMVDVNVHFQDSVRLVQRLIELRKENWELAVYPVEDHAFERETSWADEYKRVLRLFENNIQNNPSVSPAGQGGGRRNR